MVLVAARALTSLHATKKATRKPPSCQLPECNRTLNAIGLGALRTTRSQRSTNRAADYDYAGNNRARAHTTGVSTISRKRRVGASATIKQGSQRRFGRTALSLRPCFHNANALAVVQGCSRNIKNAGIGSAGNINPAPFIRAAARLRCESWRRAERRCQHHACNRKRAEKMFDSAHVKHLIEQVT